MDLGNERDRERFWRTWRTHLNMLYPHRQNYLTMVEEYVGSEYAGYTDHRMKKTLFNLMFMTAETETLSLAANRPRVKVTTEYKGLRAFSNKYQAVLNRVIEEIHLEETLRRIVLDAFFSVGFAKVFYAPGRAKVQVRNLSLEKEMAEPGLNSTEKDWATYRDRQNIWIDPGVPFVERVSIKDLVFDMSSESWEKIQYITHQYRVPYDWCLEDDRLNKKILREAGPSSKWYGGYRDGGIGKEERSTADISRNGYGDHDELMPMITLSDVWLPEKKRWAIALPDMPQFGPLYEERWKGQEEGPFFRLSFADVPDNVMPVSPAHNLKNLHVLTNQILRKSARQALNQKTVAAFTGDGKDARNIKDAPDMDMVRVNNQDSVKEHHFNGVDQVTMAFGQNLDGLFDRAAGNLTAKMGAGDVADTATESSLIHQSIASVSAKREFAVTDFTSKICKALGFLLWNDKYKKITTTYSRPGISVPFPVEWVPRNREGDFDQHNIAVEPHSTLYKSPEQRMQTIVSVIERVYAPLMPLFIQSGGSFDFERMNADLAEMLDAPRLRDWVKFSNPVDVQQQFPNDGQNDQGLQNNRPREYIRRNVPTGGTQQSQRQNMATALLNSNNRGEQSGMTHTG